jgi:hypothetical protein
MTIPVPWSTGFEDGFCGYYVAGGRCYSHDGDGSASFEVAQTPVHGGHYAAAFGVTASDDAHSRCYLEGKLPKAAYYGAWYYIPAVSKNTGLWNLFHFQVHRQSNTSDSLTNFWDISLENDDTGGLRLYVWGPSSLGASKVQGDIPSVPIGEWFHIEMYLKLATDNSGEVAVYQNGARYLRGTGIQTDFTDSEWAQWYVGNLATKLDPAQSILYVDDVSVKASL